jgi:uncharacterized protein (TIGR03790 family)
LSLRPWCGLVLASACCGQTPPLHDRVLILVNDRMKESVEVGTYYAQRRQIPAANIVHLKTNTTEYMSLEEYKEQVENPLRKFLDANNGAMRRKILYIVPVYGIPFKVPDKFSVDSLIVFMYAGHDEMKPPMRNPYFGATGTRPLHFAEWSDGPAAANGFKMFVVTRLDGPSPAIAKGLVDKAIEGESTVNLKSGIAYFDYQGFRSKDEWQWAVDDEVRDGAERARAQGFQTVLHTQAKTTCHAQIAPATQYVWEPARKELLVSTVNSTGGLSLAVSPLAEADFTAQFSPLSTGMENSVALTLAAASDKSYIRLTYPFVPFQEYNGSWEAVLEKVVDGAPAARAVLKLHNDEKTVNSIGELKLSVRAGRITAYRNGVELMAAEDKSGKPLAIARAGIDATCWLFGIRNLKVQDAEAKVVWTDDFAADSLSRYQLRPSPVGGANALWVWGWYSGATDSYRFVPGAIGAQLTSYTAERLRTPLNGDPKKFNFNADRWGGNWVPRMLEEGVTATWGAVTEPYATFYARGPNVFDHIWAGYNFGDSFYIAENAARWVMIAVGDPLYAPAAFARR